jgi:SpoVK/Ycf46/Vps4 family AAA+-type ATPase
VSITNLRSRVKAKSSFITEQIQIRGALLYGPPGTGKTQLARAVAKSSNSFMLSVDGAEITSKWVGETEKYIKGVFSLATKLAPCVVFMDEVDSLFRKRTSDDRSWERAAVTQFLGEMDGLGKGRGSKSPFVLVATNRPMDLDEAFMRRLPQQCFVGMPGQTARAKILRLFLRDEDLDSAINIDTIAAKTKGYTGSDLRSLCAEAGLKWVMEQNIVIPDEAEEEEEEELQVCLTNDHFAHALRKIRPSVTPKCIKDLERFRDRSGTVEHVR